MRTTKVYVAAGCALALLSLAGCKREASGQVAAIVDGDEITLQEINAELGTTALPKGVDRKVAQQAALQRIVDRRLIAGVAREDGIDKDPQYITRKRRVDELLLIEMLGQKLEKTQRMPNAAAIDKYMAEHPARFSERTIYSADRIQFPMPADVQSLRVLEEDHSLEAVTKRLDTMGVKYQRGAGQLDTATIAAPILARLKALPPGEPFLVPENGQVTVAVLTGSQSAPFAGPEARALAAQAMRNEELSKQLQQRVKTAREAAKIEYQEGFAPPKPAASVKPATPAKP